MARSRRSLLGICAASLSVAVAGCSGADDRVRGRRTATTHGDGGGARTAVVSDYPEPLAAGTAREFERAYQHNRFLAEGFIGGTDTVLVDAGVSDGSVIDDGGGYLVGVTASIATEDNRMPGGTATTTPTPAPSYDDEFAAWYHLTPGRVRRTDPGTDLPGTPGDVDLSDATTVRCV